MPGRCRCMTALAIAPAVGAMFGQLMVR